MARIPKINTMTPSTSKPSHSNEHPITQYSTTNSTKLLWSPWEWRTRWMGQSRWPKKKWLWDIFASARSKYLATHEILWEADDVPLCSSAFVPVLEDEMSNQHAIKPCTSLKVLIRLRCCCFAARLCRRCCHSFVNGSVIGRHRHHSVVDGSVVGCHLRCQYRRSIFYVSVIGRHLHHRRRHSVVDGPVIGHLHRHHHHYSWYSLFCLWFWYFCY